MAEFESCDKCRYSSKSDNEYPCNKCVHSATDKFKPKTRADVIRSMNDEELAEFLDNVFNNIFEGYEFPCEFCTKKINCDVCFKEWLQSEAE